MSSDPLLIASTLATRSRVQQRDRWDRPRLKAFQDVALERLLRHAQASSPYYREVLHKPSGPRLADVPILTKPVLMEQWDQICASPGLRLSDVEQRLSEMEQGGVDPGRPWQKHWWLAATGGTSGRRAVLAWNRQEWTQVLTSYARVNDWAGVAVSLRQPLRTAIVSSLNPTHQSAAVGASLRSGLVPTLRLDARTALEDLVRELNRFRPRLLVAYASMISLLADAQLSDQLHIQPERVIAASEQLTHQSRRAAQGAWGESVIVDSYAATETASIASTCRHGGWHLSEDFVIVEPVDEQFRPVPAGVTADKVLVTVLFSRTLPLIRYELSDCVRLSPRQCSCGLPFALLDAVEGRTEDTLSLPGRHGAVRVNPIVFHTALDALAPHGWQVEQRPDRLTVRVVGPMTDTGRVRRRLLEALANLTIESTGLDVVVVTAMERTTLGKAPLVKAFKP